MDDPMLLMNVLRLEMAMGILQDVDVDYLRDNMGTRDEMARRGITKMDLNLLSRLLQDIENLKKTARLVNNKNREMLKKIRGAGMN